MNAFHPSKLLRNSLVSGFKVASLQDAFLEGRYGPGLKPFPIHLSALQAEPGTVWPVPCFGPHHRWTRVILRLRPKDLGSRPRFDAYGACQKHCLWAEILRKLRMTRCWSRVWTSVHHGAANLKTGGLFRSLVVGSHWQHPTFNSPPTG